jgi:hypothetical protein
VIDIIGGLLFANEWLIIVLSGTDSMRGGFYIVSGA